MNLSRRLAKLEVPIHERAARLRAAHALQVETPLIIQSLHTYLGVPVAELAVGVLTRHLDASTHHLANGEVLTETDLEGLPATPDVLVDADTLMMQQIIAAIAAVEKRIGKPACDQWITAVTKSEGAKI